MEQVTSAASGLQLQSVEQLTYRKVTMRIVPLLFICYLGAYLDRVNVGFAKLQMLHDLGFSETVYGFGAGIFFLGYVLFEVPSNIALHRVGARLWITRIMLTWAVISACMIFVKSPISFYFARFLLGVAEAGFIPGVLLYLTYWYPAKRRGRITALFLTAIPMSSIFGGPLSGWILKELSGARGLAGWQWLFLVEAIPSLVLGFVVLRFLDDRVAAVKWLTPEEKRIVSDNIATEEREKEGFSKLSQAFTSGQVWLLGLIYFCVASGIYIISFWLPTIIKGSGVSDPLEIGLLTAVPYIVAIVAMLAVNADADRTRERRWHVIVPSIVTGLGLAVTALSGTNTALAMVGLVLAAAGASSAQSAFWTLPAAFLGGAAAAAGIALVNALGNIAGFASTFIVGWMTDLTHSTSAGLYAFAGLAVIGGLLILRIPARLVNK
jgi:D-galactonate transporter